MLSERWSLEVIDSPEINAFVLPNGSIFVHTGMLRMADVLSTGPAGKPRQREADDTLAAVLGHEMAHALLGHTAEQVPPDRVLYLEQQFWFGRRAHIAKPR